MVNFGMLIGELPTEMVQGRGERVPVSRFPHTLTAKLEAVLMEHARLWSTAAWDAFTTGDALYLRVVLEGGNQPFYLYLHQDGDVLQFETPLVREFPEGASAFVLSELCGRNTLMSFRVDLEPIPVLYGWGRFELAYFESRHTELLPHLMIKIAEAKEMLETFLHSTNL
jgi:hypothetical protein